MANEYVPIDIRALAKNTYPKAARFIPGFVYNYLHRILHIDELNTFFEAHNNDDAEHFLSAVSEYLGYDVSIEGEGMDEICRLMEEGRQCMVVSNHPYGGPEAMSLMAHLIKHNKDMKLVTQSFLSFILPLKSCCVYNKKGVRTLLDTIKGGNSVLIYPAGFCSRKLSFGEVYDYGWYNGFVKIAQRYNLPILVIHTEGAMTKRMHRWNSFRHMVHLKIAIETLYLPDEMFLLKGKAVNMHAGSVIYPEMLTEDVDATEWSKRIRQYCYNLGKDHGLAFDPKLPATLPEK